MGRKPFMKNANGYAVDLPERGPGNIIKWKKNLLIRNYWNIKIFGGANSSIKLFKLLPRIKSRQLN